jgi:hypothetical protein
MSVLARVNTARVTMSQPTIYVVHDAAAESVVEIKSSKWAKEREVRRYVERERRSSIQREQGDVIMERRGSRDDVRRKSCIGLAGEKSVWGVKRKVTVIVG